MIRLSANLQNMLLMRQMYQFASNKPHRPKRAHTRIKKYASNPYYKLKTLIRPPDLTDPDITFPIKIPIRYRHVPAVRKQLFIDNSSKIHWQRLQPNQILLGLQNPQYLSFDELTEGLQYLSRVQTQQKYNWNQHQWVSNAMNTIRDKFHYIKKKDKLKYYWLMKRLRYSDETFWKKMYAKIQDQIYDVRAQDFQYFFLEYHGRYNEVFSENAQSNFHKLMQNQIRQYKPESIVKIFEIYHQENRLNTYWLQNLFNSLFKSHLYKYNSNQIGRIFRIMMVIGHQENERLYSNLYERINKIEFKNIEELDDLVEVLEQVRQIFISHRVQMTLEYLAQKRKQMKQQKTEKIKTLQEMVKDDLRYFLQRRKLKQINSNVQAV